LRSIGVFVVYFLEKGLHFRKIHVILALRGMLFS
jgi:hypothetical protein